VVDCRLRRFGQAIASNASPASHRWLFSRHRRRCIAGSAASHRRRCIAGSSAAIAGVRLGFAYALWGLAFRIVGQP
jgi:hypothetical protein